MLTFTTSPQVLSYNLLELFLNCEVKAVLWAPRRDLHLLSQRRVTGLQRLRGPIREFCLCFLSLILISVATGTASVPAQRQGTPSAQTTTTPLYGSSLICWPVPRKAGETASESCAKHLLNIFDRTACSVSQLCHCDKREAAQKAELQIRARVTGANVREGVRPNINGSCSCYSPRILRQA